jgi:hypothetical protein
MPMRLRRSKYAWFSDYALVHSGGSSCITKMLVTASQLMSIGDRLDVGDCEIDT